MVLKVGNSTSEKCEDLICVASTIGKLQHTKYSISKCFKTGDNSGFVRPEYIRSISYNSGIYTHRFI